MTSGLIKSLLNELDGDQLEELVLHYVNEYYRPNPPAQRIGVSGQSQKGVDIYAHVDGQGHMGLQSKAYRRKKLTKALLAKELSDCHKFTPALDYYTVVTLKQRDATLQQYARSALLHDKPNRVSILAFEDLASIVEASKKLKQVLYNSTISHSDFEEIKRYTTPISGVAITLSPQDIDQSLPNELRSAEEWVNNGMPLRALATLDAQNFQGHQSAATRIRCRALYSLGRYAEVLAIAQAESASTTPSSSVLMLGAIAAEALGKPQFSADLSALALTAMTDATRVDSIGGYIRLIGRKGDVAVSTLEAIATEHLGGGEKVAVALADAAASLGDRRRAAHWFKIARDTRPTLGLPTQINEAATSLALAIDESDEQTISRIIVRLEQFLETAGSVEDPSYRSVILINLGAAYHAVGRYQDAASSWDQVLEKDSDQHDVWIRRCILGEQDKNVSPPDQALFIKHATNPMRKLAFASALTSANRVEEAIAVLDDVLQEDNITALETSIVRVERLRIRARSDDLQDVIEDAISGVSDVADSLPEIGWLAMQYPRASRENRLKIDFHLSRIDPNELSTDGTLAIATPIATGSSGTVLRNWVSRLKTIAFDAAGDIKNEQAANILAEIQADSLDFSGCVATLKKIKDGNPENAQARLRLARAHYDAGDRQQSLAELDDVVVSGNASAKTIRDWAVLSASLGQRRSAKRIFLRMEKPKLTTASDYISLMQARVVLGVKEDDAEAIEFLRSGAITPDRASQVFSLGVHRKSNRPMEAVGEGTIVYVRIGDAIDDTYFISNSGTPSLPGIRTLAPSSHPWIEQLIGQKAGAQVVLEGDPFDGQVAEIISVSGASDFMFAEAMRQIDLSSKDTTGVQKITGSIEVQLDQARKMLAARHKSLEEQLDHAARGRFPISLMAQQFHTSPRAFLQAARSWTPLSHTGARQDIQADECVLEASNAWTFDAISILLLATIGAEELPGRLAKLPRIAKTTVAQLCDWRAEEREHRRSAGHMNLDDEGNLYAVSTSAADRVAVLQFWNRVGKIIRQCRVIDVPTVALTDESAHLIEVLGSGTLATFNTAKFHRLTLVAEELNVRAFATITTGVECAPLHGFIIEAWKHNWITQRQAMLWVTRLIDLGWNWVWFPYEWLWQITEIPDEEERWQVLQSLTGRVQRADPATGVNAVLMALSMLDAGLVRLVDRERFRQQLIWGLPALEPEVRNRVLLAYSKHTPKTSEAKKSIKLLSEWARDLVVPVG